jgi:two-component system cell cycle sensor histidine kinase/response regulator CckA
MTAELDNDPPPEPFAAHEPVRRNGSIVLVLLVPSDRRGGGRADDHRPGAGAALYPRLLALLAMVGLFNLFAFAAGIIRFADRAADDPVVSRIADHAQTAGRDRPRPCGLF